MQPSIFGKQLEDVEFSDVVAFCASQPKEGLGLDYKKDLSSIVKVVKTLVSFANTNGGWLIAGVEDEDDAPKLPVTGMPYADDFEQKVTNAIVSTVSPIVLPFYRVCKSGDSKRAFLIAYMPQSPSAPHMMQYKSKNTSRNLFFIRIADRSASEEWESTATGTQLEMMRDRRQSSVELRNQLVLDMKDVYEARFSAEDDAEEEEEIDSGSNSYGFNIAAAAPMMIPTRTYFGGEQYERAQTITILPTYPTSPVTDIPTVEHAITYEPVTNGLNDFHSQTPNTMGYGTNIYQYGAYVFHKAKKSENCYFFGVDKYGCMLNVDSVEGMRNLPDANGKMADRPYTVLSLIVMNIVGALQFADKFYAKTGVIGNLIFRVEFEGSPNCLMLFPATGTRWPFSTENLPLNATGQYRVQRDIDTITLSDPTALTSFVASVVREILYSFNYGTIDDKILSELINRAAKISVRPSVGTP